MLIDDVARNTHPNRNVAANDYANLPGIFHQSLADNELTRHQLRKIGSYFPCLIKISICDESDTGTPASAPTTSPGAHAGAQNV